MSRTVGIFNFAANLEVLAKAPLDAKQLVGTYADLTTPATWCGSGSVWLYNGAIVSVAAGANSGIYYLCDATNYTSASSWVKSGSGSVTGATNGLTLVGANIRLGGTLLTGTTINGNGKAFCICNTSSIFISALGVGSSATFGSTNTDNTYLCGNNSVNLCSAQIALSYNTNAQIFDTAGTPRGLQYGGNYRSTFLCNSLVDAAYVTGKSNQVNVYCQAVSAPYTATPDSEYIGAQCGSVICLPVSPKFGQQITVVDVSGFALNCLIVICGNGRCINGADCATINTDYGSITVVNNTVAGVCGWSATAFIN